MTAQETKLLNAFETTLTGTIGASDTTLTVNSVTDSASNTLTASCYLVINPDSATNREVILVTGVNSGTKTLDVGSVGNRYLTGSAASSGLSHASGSVVRMSPVQQHIEDLNDRVDTVINEAGTALNTTLFLDEDNMASNSATKGVTQQSVKAYVDTQLGASDLDIISDSGTIDIDLDDDSLTVTGGEGIDTSATGTTLTIAGEDATTSNKGIASFSSDNFAVSSGAVTIKAGGVDLAAEVTGTLPVANGGTGATSLTDGGVLLGSGTGAVTATSVLTNGQLLIGDGTGDPTVGTLTAGTNVSITNGAGSITIAATDTNTTYTAGDGLDLSGTTFSTDLKSNGGLVIESTELAVDLGASSITGSLDAAKIADGSVSDAEFQRLDGVTSDIQTQLDGKQASGSYITASSTDTLTNKTFNVEGTGNSISNIDVADLKSGVLDTDLSSVSGSDDTLASAKAIKTYVDSSSSGLTGYDAWYVTANVTSSGDITANLSRQSGTLVTKIGTGMTESSGVFTFPSTGIWKVSVKMQSVNIAGDTVLCYIVASDDNFSSDSNVGAAVFGNNSSTSATGGTGYGEVLLDIEDVSTDKVKFEAVSISSGSYITGGTYPDASAFTFVRMGDT